MCVCVCVLGCTGQQILAGISPLPHAGYVQPGWHYLTPHPWKPKEGKKRVPGIRLGTMLQCFNVDSSVHASHVPRLFQARHVKSSLHACFNIEYILDVYAA